MTAAACWLGYLLFIWLVLAVLYPIGDEVALDRGRWIEWTFVYAEMAILVTVVMAILTVIVRKVFVSALSRSIAAFTSVAVMLSCCAWMFGTMSALTLESFPLGQAHANFLREFMYIELLLVAFLAALAAGVIASRRQSHTEG